MRGMVPKVLYKVMAVKVLLHGTDGQRNEFIRVWRQHTVNWVIELFEKVQAVERFAFESKSYFFGLDQGRCSPVSNNDPDLNPDVAEDVRPVIHGFEEADEADEGGEGGESEDVAMEGARVESTCYVATTLNSVFVGLSPRTRAFSSICMGKLSNWLHFNA
jgi:hypothetical protein